MGRSQHVPCLDPDEELAEAPGDVLQPPRLARGPGLVTGIESTHVGVVIAAVGTEERGGDQGGGVVIESQKVQGALENREVGGWVGYVGGLDGSGGRERALP